MAIPFGEIMQTVGGVANLLSGQDTNRQMSQIADRQMQFQERMSNTAHQREVADLKAAGLNPILSATGGSGASTPQGSMPSLQPPQINLPDFMSYGVSLKNIELAEKRLNIDAANSAASIMKSMSEAELNRLQGLLNKLGIGAKFIGTDAADKLNKTDLKDVGNSLKQGFEKLKKEVLTPNLVPIKGKY